MIELRDFQLECNEKVWRSLLTEPTALVVMPTGSGKTITFIAFMQKCLEKKPDIKIVVLVNKVKLVQQTFKVFSEFFPPSTLGIYCGTEGEYRCDRPITIASIQSIHDVKVDRVNLLILDEVHGVDQEEGRYMDFIEYLKTVNEKLKIVAYTATPFRASGYIFGKGKLFPRPTYRKTLPEMIARGYLVPPRLKRVDHQFDVRGLRVRAGEFVQEDVEKLTGNKNLVELQIRDALSRAEGRKKIVWACSSINHAKEVHGKLVELGEEAALIHSQMNEALRAWNTQRFEGYDLNPARHLVFITIVSEGYDYPPIDCVVLMRPMRSAALYVQTVGRGLRLFEGKTDALVLDYGKVVETLGPLDNPFVPTAGAKAPSLKPEESVMKFCPNCLEYIQKELPKCPACEYEFPKAERNSSLDQKAAERGDLLSTKPKSYTVGVRAVHLSRYESKSGNLCLRIDYETMDYAHPTISEFFVWNNEFAQRRAFRRLMDLEVDLKPRLEQFDGAIPRRFPKEITFIQERYARVVKLHFTGTADPARDFGLPQPTA